MTVLLIILDGFGIGADTEFNAITQAKMPNYQHLLNNYPHSKLDASGLAVGLPVGQFGNSEVGHLNIGAGRVVYQDISRIDQAIKDGSFFTNKVLLSTCEAATSGTIHLLGILSDGGVHGHMAHMAALMNFAQKQAHIKQVWLHLFLDGRDTPPKSALKYLKQLELALTTCSKSKIATISGRYYAMDRDGRYERIKLSYDAIINAQGLQDNDPVQLINSEYDKGCYDEFILPHVIGDYPGVNDGDGMIHTNFRADRALQLTHALIDAEFNYFARTDEHTQTPIALTNFASMTNYDARLNNQVLFVPQVLKNTLGEYIANRGLHQLRIAETEKYPHVTFFFNGGRMEPFINEERILIPSPRDVATYDLKPQMSLEEVTRKLIAAIHTNRYDFIISNFANGDMVGHSGNLAAAIKAVETLDVALGKVVKAMQAIGGDILIVADHGNCEQMFDVVNQQPHTQHTTNLVPCIYVGKHKNSILTDGVLADVAPTLLTIANLAIPEEMTGRNLWYNPRMYQYAEG